MACLKEIATNKLGRYLSEKTKSNYLYDRAVYDSNIEKEIIEKEVDSFGTNKVIVFAKLPKFSIPTPYKEYEPDFAYLIENDKGKKIFLSVRQKDTTTTMTSLSTNAKRLIMPNSFSKP